MVLGFYTKDLEKTKKIMDAVADKLNAKGHSVIIIKDFKNVGNIDRILSFGGDGTMLATASFAVKKGIPMLGVNQGNVGFLAYMNENDDPNLIADTLLSNKFEHKIMLDINFNGKKYTALNEVFVGRKSSKPVYSTLYIDGKAVDRIHSDGIIVATPTGSTGYSLSAGGPILSPDVEALIINPVCPHSLHSRPIVISPYSEICLKDKDFDIALSIDGTIVDTGTEPVYIRRHEKDVIFINPFYVSFYNKLLNKMNKWGVTPIEEVLWQEQQDN